MTNSLLCLDVIYYCSQQECDILASIIITKLSSKLAITHSATHSSGTRVLTFSDIKASMLKTRKESTCCQPEHSSSTKKAEYLGLKKKKKVHVKAYLYPRRTSAPPLLLALLARGSMALVISSLPSVSPTSAASLSSARSDSKLSRATANCSSRPLHLLPGISSLQVCNSSAEYRTKKKKKKNTGKKKKLLRPPEPSTSAVWSQSCRGKGKKTAQTIKTK